MSNLAEALPKEQERVRNLVGVYESLPGGAGLPAAMLMKASLRRAEQASASGDVIAMLQSYEDLKRCIE